MPANPILDVYTADADSNVPPPPKGFKLDKPLASPAPATASATPAIPPPPAGFTLDAPTAKAPDQPGFLDRVGADVTNRANEGADAIVAYKNREQGLGQTGLQLLGKMGAGTAGDIVGEAAKSATPDFIKNAPQKIAGALDTTRAGKSVGDAGLTASNAVAPLVNKAANAYGDFTKNNPNATRSLESIGNILNVLFGAKGSAAAEGAIAPAVKGAVNAVPPALEKGGTALVKNAAKQAEEAQNKFVQGLVLPKQTAAVKAEQVGRTTEKGIFKQKVVEPTAQEKAIAKEVGQIPGVSPKNSLQGNYNVIAKANTAEAEQLIAKLKEKDVAIKPEEFDAKLNDALGELKEHPLITGDAETTATRVIDGMKKISAKNPMTASGLLQTRKDFDNWVRSLKGNGIFDPQRDSAASIAIQKIRQATNDFIESKVPDAKFKESLRKQSNLYRAMDNLEAKAAAESPNALARTWQKALDMIPGKNMLEKEGALGVGGTAAYMAGSAGLPIAIPAGAGLGAYGLYKGVTSPFMQNLVGQGLTKGGKALGQNITKEDFARFLRDNQDRLGAAQKGQ